ncbi:YdaS family helix-turn-helix protein [Methylobacterium sp. Leaf123]|uniref:YdaS family helix-turn-helix protein n=1 Tax=Methylobacterium sp. Leaf123 TaxID=1736264 RepID=UPI00191094A1|nr:YdaS family helix-turn-helix protein [Methylobacterium sp. Leaf123]
MAILSPLKAYRARSKMTLEKASELFGVHKTTFMRWEKHRVPAEMVLDLEKKLGISRHELRPDIYPASQ